MSKCHAGDRSYTAVNSHMAGGVLELVKPLVQVETGCQLWRL